MTTAGPQKILTGPQALGVAAAALLGWAFFKPLARLGHLLWWGPDLTWPDDDFDEADFVGANPDLYLGPETPTKE